MENQGGFTLLEILIALSIISILAVIAIPMYAEYQIRAKVSEGLSLVEPVKNMVIEYYETYGTWPDSNAEAAVEAPNSFRTDNVDNIAVTAATVGAAITITYSIPALDGNNTIVFTASAGDHVYQWSCKHGTVNNKFRPPVCKI